MSTYPDRRELYRKAVLLLGAYTGEVTWFGRGSVVGAVLRVAAFMGEIASQLAVRTQARLSPLAATTDNLDALLAEFGTERRTATRAQVLVIVRPARARVTNVDVGGGTGTNDLLEVDASTGFTVGMSIRIRNADATVTETATILAITTGTGPNGGDELEVAALGGTYTPDLDADDVVVLARISVPAGTALTSTSGVAFTTLTSVTTGESNPLLDGMSTSVSLADKVIAEADEAGEDGKIEPYDITNLNPEVDGVVSAFNPSPGYGGNAEETDSQARNRLIHQAAVANQTTEAWLIAACQSSDEDVMRVRPATSSSMNTVGMSVLTRAGGALTTTKKEALIAYLIARSRAGLDFEIDDVTLTEVSITATITLARGYELRQVFINAASAVATYLDAETWAWGTDVDAGTLYDLVRAVDGVESLDPGDFTPASDVAVASDSLPTLVYLSLTDGATGDTVGGDLAQVY